MGGDRAYGMSGSVEEWVADVCDCYPEAEPAACPMIMETPFTADGRSSLEHLGGRTSRYGTVRSAVSEGRAGYPKRSPHGSLSRPTVRTGVLIWWALRARTPFGPAPCGRSPPGRTASDLTDVN